MNQDPSQNPPSQPDRITRADLHALNNQLAIIGSQSGLISDMLNPKLGLDSTPEAILNELKAIDHAVHKARDIIKKMRQIILQAES